MAIFFLRSYSTKSVPPEHFAAGQTVSDRDQASELHFVTRGAAAYIDGDGNLTDAHGRPVAYLAPSASDVELGLDFEAGEVLTIDGLQTDLDAARAEHEKLAAEHETALANLDAANTRADGLADDLKEAKEAGAKLEAARDDLQAKLDVANASIAELTKPAIEDDASSGSGKPTAEAGETTKPAKTKA